MREDLHGLTNKEHLFNEQDEYFSGSLMRVLPRICSNHYPLLLTSGAERGPSPLQFENESFQYKELPAFING